MQHALVDACCGCGRGPNYFEVDIDVGSSKSAASVVGLVQGALKGLVIDMAITMEGHSKVALAPCCLPMAQLVQSKSLMLQHLLQQHAQMIDVACNAMLNVFHAAAYTTVLLVLLSAAPFLLALICCLCMCA